MVGRKLILGEMVGIRWAMGKLGAAMARIEWMEEGGEIWNEIGRG